MHVLITGADGYIGRALAKRLAHAPALAGRRIVSLTLLDLRLADPPRDPRVVPLPTDLADTEALRAVLAARPVDAVFHLASIPGGTAEQQYEAARRVNLEATTALLEAGRAQTEAGRPAPRFVFASSIAVFGALPERVDDHTPPAPLMTYGVHKLIGEWLVNDFSRRGWVDGRALRLPGVLARPPARTGQLSAFMSDIVRELAAGRRYTCPTSAQATVWAASLPVVVDNLLHAAELPAARLGAQRAWTLPTLRFSMAELVEAVAQVHGADRRSLVDYAPRADIEALFGRQPPLTTAAADALGFGRDDDLAGLVRRALLDG